MLKPAARILRVYLGFATLFVTLKEQYFVRYVAGTMYISQHLKYNNPIVYQTMQRNANLNRLSFLSQWNIFNAIVLLQPAARILRMYIPNLCVCFFLRIKFFSPLWYFSTVGKNNSEWKWFNSINRCCNINKCPGI